MALSCDPISKLLSAEARQQELAGKRQRLLQFLEENQLDAYLICRHENIAWATGGQVDLHVGLLREIGVASLLITRKGGSFYITTNNEAPRLRDEEFEGLEFEPILQPWTAADVPAAVAKVAGHGRVASDDPTYGFPVVPLKPLRLELTEPEVVRYRWLGAQVAAAAANVLELLRPGVREAEMQSMLAARLLEKQIQPSVFLTAADDRVRQYRHAVPRCASVSRLAMLNFCARRWGLCISITRLVHFGRMAGELEEKFAAVARVNAQLLHATREGASADELFSVAQYAYADCGFPGEEQMHHQGGATGYWEREWVARPAGAERVLRRQAFAWNPSLQGAKCEDTVLRDNDSLEVLTKTPTLPVMETTVEGVTYASAGVLLA